MNWLRILEKNAYLFVYKEVIVVVKYILKTLNIYIYIQMYLKVQTELFFSKGRTNVQRKNRVKWANHHLMLIYTPMQSEMFHRTQIAISIKTINI